MLSVRRAICEAGGGGVPIKFLSTPSARRATLDIVDDVAERLLFLSTPSVRRATAKTEKNISAFVSL